MGHDVNSYGFEILIGGQTIPIAPSKIVQKIKNKNKTIDLMNGGELNLINPNGLLELEMDILLPKHKGYPFSRYYMPQYDYLLMLTRLKNDETRFKKTFQLIINRDNEREDGTWDGMYETNIPMMTLEDFTINEDAKSYGQDIMVSLKMKQYIPPKLKKLKIEKAEENKVEVSKEEKKESTKPKTATHTVVKGDMLSILCKKYLGDGTNATCDRIAKLNNIADPDHIEVGWVIKFE